MGWQAISVGLTLHLGRVLCDVAVTVRLRFLKLLRFGRTSGLLRPLYGVRRWKAEMTFGDDKGREAARRLIEAHYDDVFAYCRRRVASSEDAQDLTQDVFLRFFRASSRYRDEGKPLALLLTIARNVCIDAARSRRFTQVPFEEELHDLSSSDRPESSSVVAQALERLNAGDREVLELRYDQGLGVGEIAQVLGISRFSASRRIRRALAGARKALEEEGFR